MSDGYCDYGLQWAMVTKIMGYNERWLLWLSVTMTDDYYD